ncbi:MAG: hypothetical protein ACXVJD_11765 [Mucilaginibacter sp.]
MSIEAAFVIRGRSVAETSSIQQSHERRKEKGEEVRLYIFITSLYLPVDDGN